jgi:malonate-semialdehyde dehydrogenase (acetylating)/methylmalonate-semialdehyde dehydrogenase
MKTIEHWISGAATSGASTRSAEVYNPATGQVQARVLLAEPADVDEAVQVAKKSFESWQEVSLARRVRIMFTFRDLVERHLDDLAKVVSAEHGKVVSDAKGEVIRGLEVVEFACGIPQLMKGEYSDQVSTDVDAYSLRQPLGVCAGITPFNFPAMVPMWMHPIAIATGNTFVLKPSERDPSASNLLAELYAEAGLPDGVFNVVHGDKVAVDALLDHPEVAAISFVGSTPIAAYVHRRASERGKRVQALGGAKNHAVVLPDADMDFAANHITAAGYGSAGQRCMAISAVVAVGPAGDVIVERLRQKADEIRVEAADRIAGYVSRGEQAGATLVVDGRDPVVAGYEEGFFIGPSLFDHVGTDMDIYTDEIFGPVLVVLRAESLNQAIEVINANPYGNGTAIFTSSGHAARTFQRQVHVGMIGINVPIPVPMAYYSFGGWKDSLFGDTHVHGAEGVRFYTRAKAITSRWPDLQYAEHHQAHMHFPTAV